MAGLLFKAADLLFALLEEEYNNQTTSNLSIYSHETSQDKLPEDYLLLSSVCMTNYMKSCSFLHAHFFELMIVVENLFKKVYGEKLIY